MKVVQVLLLLIFGFLTSQGQSVQDTADLKDVVVKAYFSEQPLLRLPASVSVISQTVLQNQPGHSLLPGINTAPGVRMEERSPGSYRLSIRGSLLRSPFGIRNLKIYLDDFLLTDAGGNSYLNLLDAASVERIEVLKGPEGSVFGANSGGVVLIDSRKLSKDSAALSAGITGGSYGLLHQNATAQFRKKDFQIGLNQSIQKSDGYRRNSSMNRKGLLLSSGWSYSKSAELKALLLYSDLYYQTPGGLTAALLDQNPRQARPGAEEQRASVYNETFLSGLSHSKQILPGLRHVVALTGSLTDFANPFITNYESRKEKSLGIRTFIELSSDKWKMQYGLESQQTKSEIRNYDNVQGQPQASKSFADISARQSFIFTRFSGQLTKSLTLETAFSLNFYGYDFKDVYPKHSAPQRRNFKTQLMPRAALSYMFDDNVSLRASVSRGYSPPTIEELRPSNLLINTDLEPEYGWNYESGVRMSFLNNRIYFDASLFHFNLTNALVRRVNAEDAEYFVNAGGTRQDGLEAQFNGWIIVTRNVGLVRGLKINGSYTYSRFCFSDYITGSSDFSGRKLTGVPGHNMVSSANLHLPFSTNLYVQHSYVSSIPLNDANSHFAEKYHLMQAKLTWKSRLGKYGIKTFAGVDNLLNAKYSLGNDLNAFAARYYNPSAPRNYYAGFSAHF